MRLFSNVRERPFSRFGQHWHEVPLAGQGEAKKILYLPKEQVASKKNYSGTRNAETRGDKLLKSNFIFISFTTAIREEQRTKKYMILG